MKYRALGKTGLIVSEIGFGAWGIGGTKNGAIAYGPTDDKESEIALKRAYDLGITFYDTSDLYGHGHSESLIGTTLNDVRNKIVIASKVGYLGADGAQDFSPKHIKSSIEASLNRLRTDYLDLYQLHDPPMSLLDQDPSIVETLELLRTQGKIRAFGISVRAPEDGLLAVRKYSFNSIQVNFNLVDQRAREIGLLDSCARSGVGIIGRAPLCFGFLTGSHLSETKFDRRDHRNRWSRDQIELWASAYQKFSPVLKGEGYTQAQIALRFCLSHQSVSTVVPGMLREQEVEENVVASEIGPYTERELLQLEDVYNCTALFLGKK